MRKTYLLAIGGMLAALLSCSRKQESEMPQSPAAPSEDRVAVQLGLDMKGLVQTKSLGTVDVWNGTQQLFIYAFPFVNGEPDWEHPFIDNVGAFSPANGTTGTIDLYNPTYTTPTHNEPFYYEEGTTYDFFGYYIDDALDVTVNNGEPDLYDEGWAVWLNLNGQQDIMHATTDRALAAADGGVSLERVYSAYAARRGVQPELVFQHALSRFRFRLLSGSASATQKVTVDALSVEADTRAALVVAGPQAGYFIHGNAGWLNLPMASAVHLPAANGTQTPLDGCIMVTPGFDSYKLRLHLNQEGVTDSPANTSELVIKMEDLVGATEPLSVAGHSYWVNITVYGLNEIVLSVSLADWDVVGTVEVDPDADLFITAADPAPVTSAGGDVSVTLHKNADTQYTYTLDSDWVHIANAPAPAPQAPVTKAYEPVEETLYFTIDANPGTTRVANIRFYVNGLPDAVVQICQEGASDFPDEYGIYPRGTTSFTEHTLDTATELMGVYALSSQRWSRILSPSANTVYELGPIPASLSLDQEFDATYSITVAGEVTASQSVHVKVLSLQGRKVKMLDATRLIGFTLIY